MNRFHIRLKKETYTKIAVKCFLAKENPNFDSNQVETTSIFALYGDGLNLAGVGQNG